ncbi:uncharacterized protein LOC134527657 [Bacillus rossius redtenbacheri]|uniref:uncharacterized protein LOC134527657 n=1 Tax=Bacillus rossius redtenbacheri TaxID=93214 RepID=UPI002FDCA405
MSLQCTRSCNKCRTEMGNEMYYFKLSASSCGGIADVFKSMFGEGVPEDFSLSSTKFRYLLTDALSPYFRNVILKDMDGAYYSVCYDKTTNHTGRKELQIAIRYWSNTKLQIITHHLETFFIGSATGEILVEKINSALDNAGLPRQKILMLGSDCPNVNKKVARIICEELVSIRKAPLVNIGTCSIHTLHNAFLSGLDKLGEDVADLVMAVHDFFDGWPSRCEDYLQIQDDLSVPKHSFIKHVPSRWLTLEGAASRLIEQWEALKKYFLSYVPKKRNSLGKSNNYKRILSLLKKPTIKAELLFVCSSARVFTRFTGAFQKEEPMIHVMHDELETLAKILLGKVCKPELIQTVGVSEDLLKTENLHPAQKIHVEKEILTEISKVDERFQLEFLAGVKNHYVEAVTHVIRKSPLILKPLLKNCRCLQPEERVLHRSCRDIVALAKGLPIVIDESILLDEWKLLQCEKESVCGGRIDDYWALFFVLKNSIGDDKYPNVAKVVKSVLALSHGNADLERGFSLSSHILTQDKASMSERTLNAAMTVKSAIMKMYHSKPDLVPITRELLAMARVAHSSYLSHLQNEKALKEEAARKKLETDEKKLVEAERIQKLKDERKIIAGAENKLKILQSEEQQKRKTADALFGGGK